MTSDEWSERSGSGEDSFVAPEPCELCQTSFDLYINSMFWALGQISGIGSEFMPTTGNEIIYVLFSMMIGLTFFALLLNQITILGAVIAGETEIAFKDEKNRVLLFLKDNLPENTQLVEETIEVTALTLHAVVHRLGR